MNLTQRNSSMGETWEISRMLCSNVWHMENTGDIQERESSPVEEETVGKMLCKER